MSQLPDHYRTLQVDPEAEPEIITAAFRVLARRLHPDRDITGVHEFRMAELNRAYSVLRDPVQRRQYDAERKLARPMQPMQPMGPGIPDEPPERPGGLSARIRAAAGASSSVQPAGVPGETRLNFGRYAGMSLQEIAAQDTEYLRWLSRHSSGLRFRNEIERILRGDPQATYSPPSPR
jgi:curved DNA-binding protein CbpA